MRFSARHLTCRIGERCLFAELGFALEVGEILVVRGPSGSGKSRLLRQLAWLDEVPAGELSLDGRSPAEWGAPAWRAEVSYVAARPANLPGTPSQHVERIAALGQQKQRAGANPRAIAAAWGLSAAVWEQPWTALSDGERQRAHVATIVARRPSVLLLDEPTACVDAAAMAAMEDDLRGHTAVWVTHDAAQAARLGGRVLELGG